MNVWLTEWMDGRMDGMCYCLDGMDGWMEE